MFQTYIKLNLAKLLIYIQVLFKTLKLMSPGKGSFSLIKNSQIKDSYIFSKN